MLLKEFFNSGKIKKFQEICAKRKKTSLGDFTDKEIAIIVEDIENIIREHKNIKKIWITGSYVKGNHVLTNDDKAYLKLREYFKLNQRISDRDYITDPKIENKFGKIDLIPLSRNNRILIFDNGLCLFKK